MFTGITREPIDPGAVLARAGAPADGAVLLFLGTVRDRNDDRAVSGMRYEAYEAMAASVLREIAEGAARELDSERIAIVHRIGELAVGEVSVAIAVSAAHRAQVYDVSRRIIEEIKRRLPIWKHEHYVSGESRWVEGVEPPVPEVALE